MGCVCEFKERLSSPSVLQVWSAYHLGSLDLLP
jgi:hypothetical protein